jgi:hypothetical protein
MNDDRFQIDSFNGGVRDIAWHYPPLPPWLERRLLRANEKVTWVRGPRWQPWWERYVTHPGLFLVAAGLGAGCVGIGRLLAGSWSQMPDLPAAAAGFIMLASILVLALSAGYFTRLVVTNYRLVILQGYEVCRSWRIGELPPSLVHYGVRVGDEGDRTVDLDALRTMLGSSTDQFADSKTIMALGKQLDGIKASGRRR